jgi:putative copper export protein
VSEPRRQPSPAKVISLPRTRRLSWASVTLEYAHQLVLALWFGGLAAIALLAAPSLLSTLAEPREAAWAALELVLKTSFLGAGAGAFLLLTTLLMHLLALRSVRATVLQTAFLLAMTFAAVTLYVAVAPPMEDLLRGEPSILAADRANAGLVHFRALHRLSDLLVGVQLFLGATLLVLGVRRWYRYVPTGLHRATMES